MCVCACVCVTVAQSNCFRITAPHISFSNIHNKDVVTARAVWDPCTACVDDDDAFARMLLRAFAAFGSAAPALAQAVHELATSQRQFFIYGRLLNGTAPADVVRHNAQVRGRVYVCMYVCVYQCLQWMEDLHINDSTRTFKDARVD
jgi:hypothetical protein